MDRKFLRAYILKAEALYQICQFEHSLLIFHRGLVRTHSINFIHIWSKLFEFDSFFNLYIFFKSFCQALSPDNDKLKQGVQKCHKTIKDALSNANVFHAEGTETLFLILRKTTELRSSEIGRYKYQGRGGNDSGNVVGLHQILGMLKVYLYLTCELEVPHNLNYS